MEAWSRIASSAVEEPSLSGFGAASAFVGGSASGMTEFALRLGDGGDIDVCRVDGAGEEGYLDFTLETGCWTGSSVFGVEGTTCARNVLS